MLVGSFGPSAASRHERLDYDAQTASDKYRFGPDIRLCFRPWSTMIAVDAAKPPAAAESAAGMTFRAVASVCLSQLCIVCPLIGFEVWLRKCTYRQRERQTCRHVRF